MKFQRRHWLEDFAWRVERVTQSSGYRGVCFLSVYLFSVATPRKCEGLWNRVSKFEKLAE
jgi:hypothetical protein